MWISIGKSRKDTKWKPVDMTWTDLVNRCRKPVRTHETVKEYREMKRDRQDEIKDVGGFVGGSIKGGNRKKGSVVSRQLITLDVDFGKADFFDDFCLLFPDANALVYSTHKHTPETPRWRLVIPLDREVMADEYEAISRKIAEFMGIDLFDPTTFQPERLMYWPSCSKDGEYVVREQAGVDMSADWVLSKYQDWRDISQWAYGSKDVEKRESGIKQADPTTKEGLIGAFCRVYTISGAIDKFLKDEYEPTDDPDRYTYLRGSTAKGLVVYGNDTFAYSHHGTDPSGGHLCNAFDLVRIHKYGHLDGEVKEGTNTSKRPSHLKMLEDAGNNPEIVKELMTQRLKVVETAFDEINDVEEGAPEKREGGNTVMDARENKAIKKTEKVKLDTTWLEKLKTNKKGELFTSVENIKLILENDPGFAGRIRYNELINQLEVIKKLPWDVRRNYPRVWNDADWVHLRVFFQMPPYKLQRSPKIEDGMAAVVENNRYHPIRNYLEGLIWDRGGRVEKLLIEYLGAEDTPYIRAVTRKTLIAAVARVFQPGIKFDYVLTLVGKQGIGKSTLIQKISKGWFTDTFNFSMLRNKEAYEQIQGQWIIEIGEMAGLKKAEIEMAKNFISSGTDSFRKSYGRETTLRARQCIFIGSCNNAEFLRKANGNRRFWPADCGVVDVVASIWDDLNDATIDQIWAEAVEYWRAGEQLSLSAEMEKEAFVIQQEHEEVNDAEGLIAEYLEILLPKTWEKKSLTEKKHFFMFRNEEDNLNSEAETESRDKVSAAEIWCEALGKNKGDLNTNNSKFIHEFMQNLRGWKRCKNKLSFGGYGILVGYIREKGKFSQFLETGNRSNL